MFKPLFGRVLVQRTEVSGVTASGLIVPGAEKEKPQEGTVLNAGSSVKELKIGDVIAFEKFTGTDLVVDGKEFIVMEEERVLGVISSVKTKGE